MKYRGLHNYMQRRANHRCPGRPPRIHKGVRVLARERLPLKQPSVSYKPNHRRAVDSRSFLEMIDKSIQSIHEANRQMRRKLTALEADGLFGETAERADARLRRKTSTTWTYTSWPSSSPTTSPTYEPTTGYGYTGTGY